MDFLEKRAALAERNWNDPACREAVRTWHDTCRTFDYQYMFQWLGLPVIQDPQDVLALQEVIWRCQPDAIVETGIARGGSLMLSASILAAISQGELLRTGSSRKSKVIGVDIDIRPHNRAAITSHPLAPMIELVEGSSVDRTIVEHVAKRIEGNQRVMVVLDSNHTRDHVFEELLHYTPFVSAGCAIMVMDTGIEFAPAESFNVSRPWGPGNSPLTAVNDFLASPQGQGFAKDQSIEKRHMLTCAPEGLLIREETGSN